MLAGLQARNDQGARAHLTLATAPPAYGVARMIPTRPGMV